MKLVLALALSMPAIAAAFGRATCDPKDSELNLAPDGIYCSSGYGAQEGAVKLSPPDGIYGYDGPVPLTASGQECWDACVAELGCDGFVGVDMNPKSGCTCPRVKFVDHRPAPREFFIRAQASARSPASASAPGTSRTSTSLPTRLS